MRVLSQRWATSIDGRVCTEKATYFVCTLNRDGKPDSVTIVSRGRDDVQAVYEMPLSGRTLRDWKHEILNHIRTIEGGLDA